MKQRQMTVSRIYQPGRRPGSVASIRLTGRWVEALGFTTGCRFEVREQPGRIELIAAGATKKGDER